MLEKMLESVHEIRNIIQQDLYLLKRELEKDLQHLDFQLSIVQTDLVKDLIKSNIDMIKKYLKYFEEDKQ